MATTIQLKKSGAVSNTPVNLEHGELAINYSDGKIFYKDANNVIQEFSSGSSGNAFETVNANGTLIIADSNTDILTLVSGDGINIAGNSISDTITLSVRLDNTTSCTATTMAATPAAVNAVHTIATGAYGQANAAYGQANAAYTQANTASTTAQDVFARSNLAYDQANSAYTQANSAYTQANTKVSKSGDTMTGQLNISSGGLLVTGAANVTDDIITQSTFKSLNSIGDEGGEIFLNKSATNTTLVNGVTIDVYQNKLRFFENGGGNRGYFVDISAGGGGAGTDLVSAGGGDSAAYNQANAAYGQANAAYGQANNAYAQANLAYTQANNSYGQANLAYTQANSAYTQANGAYGQANSAYTQANAAYGQANLAYTQANTATTVAQNAYGQANSAYTQANAAYAQANAAYTAANNSNLLSGGVITGTLNVTSDIIIGGNIYLGGNTTYINVATYQVNDPLIYIAANNELTDTVDIGFIGGKNTSGVYSHTGLARDASDGKWKLFDGLADEGHASNIIDFANTYLATLKANIEANSITLQGNAVATNVLVTSAYNQANLAYTQANTGTTVAQNAYAQANSAYNAANNTSTTAQNAYNQANAAYGQANLAYTQANNAYTAANNAANTVRVSQNNQSILSNKQLNFVNTATVTVAITDSGNGNANIAFTSVGGGGGGASNYISSGNTRLEVNATTQMFSTAGFTTRLDSASRTYIVRGTTTGNTETELFIDSSNSRIPVSTNTTIFYTIDIVGRRTDTLDQSAAFYLKGVAENYSGTVNDAGNLYEVIVTRNAAYSVDARADNTNDTINIYVTGINGATIRWVGLVRTIEVAG